MRIYGGNRWLSMALCIGGLTGCVPDHTNVNMGASAHSMTAADVNGDGRADLLVASVGEGADTGLEPEQLLVRLGNADGTFGEVVRSAGPYRSERLVVSDMNRDGRVDVVSFNFYGNADVHLSDGTGRLLWGGQAPGCELARGGSAADFNGDGYGDIAILCRDEGITYLRVSVGDAQNTYTPLRLYGLMPDTVQPFDSDTGDLNGDGKLDLVIVGSYNGQRSALVHLNDGQADFGVPTVIPAESAAVVLADVDHDGKLDLLSAGSAVSVARGNGNGTFQTARTLASGLAVADLVARDINGDGRPDLLAGDAATLHVFVQQADGTFVRTAKATGNTTGRDVAAGDFNGDGRVDAASLNRASPGSVSVLYNAALLSGP